MHLLVHSSQTRSRAAPKRTRSAIFAPSRRLLRVGFIQTLAPMEAIMATKKKRYYIHGDRDETDDNLYYCAECDVFFNEAHFSGRHREDHYARHKAAAKNINKLMKSSLEYFRPDHPENLFG